MSASPESFSRMRRNAGAAPSAAGERSTRSCADSFPCTGTGLFCDSEAPERHHARVLRRERLPHGLRRVVDPGLLVEGASWLGGVEALLEHPLHDLLLRLLGLALELVRVEVDLPLVLDRVGRRLLLRRPGRSRK